MNELSIQLKNLENDNKIKPKENKRKITAGKKLSKKWKK